MGICMCVWLECCCCVIGVWTVLYRWLTGVSWPVFGRCLQVFGLCCAGMWQAGEVRLRHLCFGGGVQACCWSCVCVCSAWPVMVWCVVGRCIMLKFSGSKKRINGGVNCP